MNETPNADVEIVSADVAEFIGELKERDGKDICVAGGGELAKSLFEANLIMKSAVTFIRFCLVQAFRFSMR